MRDAPVTFWKRPESKIRRKQTQRRRDWQRSGPAALPGREEKGASMGDQPPRYLSYLLRLWQVRGQDQWAWRASLESTTGQRQGFADLAALFAYLTAETELGHTPDPLAAEPKSGEGEAGP